MFRNRIFLKSLAIFFVLETIGSTVWPTISYALTSGPTAPEATSFEPVDTTDMVNLSTGDLAYNIPLLEVPGPSGGYPLSLSYHAGIQPNEEASWVGLGWTLNPGAITRNVNGFADDHLNVLNTDRFFWQGGDRHTVEVGVTLGVSGVAGVSAGLSFSQDTYQGFGYGMSVGVGVGMKNGVGVNFTAGADTYGNSYSYASLGLSMGTTNSGVNASVDVGISTNFESVSGYARGGVSVSYSKLGGQNKALSPGSASLLGASISSNNGVSTSVSVAGISGVHNSKTEKVRSSTRGFTLPLPFINLGYSYQRYWIDETENVQVNGALYNPTAEVSGSFDNKAYDSYTLLDPRLGIVDNPDPDKVLGGSFLNYDSYNVNAQGIGGSIKPYSFKNLIFKQNRRKDGYQVKQYPYPNGYRDEPFEFRFVGDFSNRYVNEGGIMQSAMVQLDPLLPYFGLDEKTGELGTATSGIYNDHLAGSRHVEWYTNGQILGDNPSIPTPADEGFIDSRATGFTRSSDGSKAQQIGGFKITNESGVTYHFGLPAYVYNEYQRSENVGDTGGDTFNELTKKEPYAYTWYLTAITGPDFVDRGPTGSSDGVLNEFDWGYWVEFEYGKWTDFYAWRNPSEGFTPDLDKDFKNFSEGLKEVYYLDAIRTRTHTALFAKSLRHDAKSTVYSYRNKFIFGSSINKVTVTPVTKNGGFIPKKNTNSCNDVFNESGTVDYTTRPTSSLKLDSIYLILNSDLASIPYTKSNGIGKYKQNYSYNWDVSSSDPDRNECDFSALQFNHHLYQNVFDVYDLPIIGSALRNKSIRIIGFDTSNDNLTPETENSFDFELVKVANPSTESQDYSRFGKLTLEGVQFKGKGGSNLIPPIKFEYDLENPLRGSGSVYKQAGEGAFTKKYILSQSNSGLLEGDIIKWLNNNKTYYAVVYYITGSSHKIKIIGNQSPSEGQSASWRLTKNPPYNKDYNDLWGMYKSDYDPEIANEIHKRAVTTISSRNTDVWSLQKVTGSLGTKIRIKYMSDRYEKPVLNIASHLRIQGIEKIPNSTNFKIIILDEVPSLDRILGAGSTINCLVHIAEPYEQEKRRGSGCPGNTSNSFKAFEATTHAIGIIIQDIYLETQSGLFL